MAARAARRATTQAKPGALAVGCPGCGSERPALLWATDPDTGARTYRCADPACAARWSVDGVQAELFDLGAVEARPLELS